MNQSSIDTLKNNFFEIQNVNSSFNQYYHLTSPYNAVIETYRCDLDMPYFKISSFSPEHTSHSLIDATELLEKMKTYHKYLAKNIKVLASNANRITTYSMPSKRSTSS